jgi:hypothetical protein
VDRQKPGPKPKELKTAYFEGLEVGRGENKRIVSPKDVQKLAALGCTDGDIATWFDIKSDTLRRNFASELAKGRVEVRMTLRRAMLENACTRHNAAVQIFLAKNMLNMTDNGMAGEDDGPLPWTDEE